ncbi:MAG: zinc-binding alcohol dehydrogenase [Haloferacaceae archaeon]
MPTARSLYFEAPGEVALRERPVPDPGPEEVRVRTRVSAVSAGTELLVYRGKVPRGLAVDDALEAFDGETFTFPLKYGYAAVGRVTACGDDVDDAWRGRRVLAYNPHETHFTASPSSLVRIPEGLSDDAAALLPTVETAASLVLDTAPRLGERVVVHGAGPVGLTTTGLLAEFPLDALAVVDPVGRRRDLAREFGADVAAPPADLDDVLARHADADPDGMDAAVELSGDPTALDDAVDAVGYDGRVVVGSWYGDAGARLSFDGHFHRDRIEVRSSQVSTLDPELRGRWTRDRRLSTAMDRLDALPLDGLVTHRVPFDEAPSAYRALDGESDDEEDSPVQVLLTYG